MDASQERVFHYHADANALGGVLTHPYKTVITTAASSSLANAGGYNSSPTVPFRLEHVLSCKAAYTHTTGSEENGHWGTLTTAVVEGVNLLEVVTADKIVSQISTTHAKVGNQRTVSFVGSQFVGLRINGHSVEPVLDRHPFPPKPAARNVSSKNKSPFAGKAAKSEVSSFQHKDVRKLAADQSRKVTGHTHAPDWTKHRYGWLESAEEIDGRGHLLCSLVKEIRGGEPEDTFGHVIHVPGFGNIFLAEVTLDQGSYHLTMIRAEMGCASSGTVSMATARTNGRTMP
ncbi:MAG TPA: choice-of-anchor P family protein [Edaphobacter sp.]|nr:choice-of-anchor P family protein [Edaphobacter sp.]